MSIPLGTVASAPEVRWRARRTIAAASSTNHKWLLNFRGCEPRLNEPGFPVSGDAGQPGAQQATTGQYQASYCVFIGAVIAYHARLT
ncbi:hypothetical protein Bxe_A0583 [Paraburkholderia xenovorans LB400]|uniref:Uncharacterized protein n=1 Tax=Paraburkholderia xenovorans (strain LB400) TaxID=266265 RepID=Q13U89_PARXL|nr:hypothetical protein Bxe_A0583 [Paraburkholderia xenovorans LB400]